MSERPSNPPSTLSASQLRSLLDQMPATVWTVDRELRFTSGVGAGLTRTGLSPGQLIGKTIYDILESNDPEFPPIAAHLGALEGESSSRTLEWKGRVYEYHVEPLRGESGSIRGCVGVALDVTDRIRTEMALRETRELTREIVSNAREGIILYDAELRYRVWNRFMSELTGVPEADVLGRHAPEVFPHLEAEGVVTLLQRALAGESVTGAELRFHVPQTGRGGWISASYGPHRDADGRIAGVIAVVRDITLRKKAEDDLSARVEFERLLMSISTRFINVAPEGLDAAITDALERISRFNRADASYVYLLSEGGEIATLTHVTGSDRLLRGAEPRHELKTRDFGWALEQLRAGSPLVVPDIQTLPGETASLLEHLAPNQIRSFVVVPIAGRGHLRGVVGFSVVGEAREWSEDSVTLLQVAGELLSNAIERLRTERALRSSEERYRLLFERNLAGVYRTSLDGRILDCNDACARIFGYASREGLLGERAREIYFDPAERDVMLERLRREHTVANAEVCFQRRDGSPVWVLENVSLLEEDGNTTLEGTIIDITDRKRVERQLVYQAHHDMLTDLPNRLLFQDRLQIALSQARRARRGLAVMFLDLDHFKMINDSLGHSAGDRLLQAVAERLKGCTREGDTIARFGGDEFTLLLQEINRREDAIRVALKLIEAIARPVVVGSRTMSETASVGIAIFPADGQDVEALLKEADRAMYLAKDAGRNRFAFASGDVDSR